MTKPLHYYLSIPEDEPIINKLTETYGEHLEKMTANQKLALASTLLISFIDSSTLQVQTLSQFNLSSTEDIQQLSYRGKLGLVRALVEHLRIVL